MEKKDRQISIKINGEEKTLEKAAKQEAAAAEEEEFQWVLPDDDPDTKVVNFQDYQMEKQKAVTEWEKAERRPLLPLKRKKKRKFVGAGQAPVFSIHKKLFISIGSAIIVGAIFGFMLLMLFTGDGEVARTTETPLTDKPAPVSATTAANVFTLDVQVVQGGAYTSDKSAQSYADSFTVLGYPAIIENAEKKYLFVALANSVEERNVLVNHFKNSGKDAFGKEWSVKGNIQLAKKEDQKLLKESKGLFQELIGMNVLGLRGEPLEKLGETTGEITALKQKIETATKEWPASSSESMGKFVDELEQAAANMQKYEETNDASHLWSGQQNLLNGLIEIEAVVHGLAKK
ncbi:hypothetical protein [Pseudalkalibacillus caeni]|uniref:SPOR domain-containing protein n=1 Tax=Exobacillus caeni TaxID=2574798 RepID=A0A5R9F9Q9_9BACL|nr:hypothetical protein [Pseudalkalibacillus caeni]TLS39239.1 hypothetical protein FCL54_02725 [Pseudalkalibacillus caeni]